MRIEMWADIVCPWCSIGRHRLTTALAQRPDVTAEVIWRPFQLHPHWPGSGLSWDDFTTQRWGSPRQARPIFARVEQVAAGDGLHFDFTRIPRVPNTAAAHRLILRAQHRGDPWPTVQALADAYFTGMEDIGDHAQLAALLAGLEPDGPHGPGNEADVRSFLDGDDLVAEVRAGQDEAHRLGIAGVPFFVVDGRYAVSGAQSVAVLHDVLDRVTGAGG